MNAPGPATRISVVVLTYNRIDSLRHLLGELSALRFPNLEIIVVDNCSEVPAATLAADHPRVRFVRAPSNLGTAGRNLGIEAAGGEITVCLDDDVSALTDEALQTIDRLFADPLLGGVCFKVIEAVTGSVTNWVHHKPVEKFADARFDSYEITEGAVAFRREAMLRAGGYAGHFFISHEGPDLAFRMMDLGYRIAYEPSISVVHAYSPHGRKSWRNYYFDTRNTFWMVVRNCPVGFGARLLAVQVGAMLVYSIRDGFFLWWLRGVRDGLRGCARAWRERKRMSATTMRKIAEMDRDRPSLGYLIRKRLFQRGVKI